MLYKTHLMLLLTTGVAFTSALPIELERFVDNVQHKFSWPSFSFNHDKQQLSVNEQNKYDRYSIVSLIPQIDYENWLVNESEYSFDAIIRNIGGYGPGLDDALPGTVIASPSKTHPNYYYQVCISNQCH